MPAPPAGAGTPEPEGKTVSRTLTRPVSLLGVPLPQPRAVILAVVGLKGGIGKTTSAVFLALCWSRLGLKVLLIDADPKAGTSRKWNRRARQAGGALPYTVEAHPSADLSDTIIEKNWHEDYDLIIIDTGGDDDRILRAACATADRVLLTASPSPADLDALRDTGAQMARATDTAAPVAVLLTAVKSPAMEADAKRAMRTAREPLPVLSAVVRHRTRYQRLYGRVPQDGMDYRAVQHELDTREWKAAA